MTLHDLWIMWNDVDENTIASVWVERDTRIARGKLRDIANDKRYRNRNVKIFGQLLPDEMPITQSKSFSSVLIIVEREKSVK